MNAQHSGFRRHPELAICAALAAGTLALYARVAWHQFVWFDDDRYLLQNPHVTTGLTLDNLRWAFTSAYASNWHPLTWLSHMIDVQLFGLNAGGHHVVNAALHAVNAALVYAVLRRMTGARARSICVAILFAVHPLHVESVAWVSERKDLLSTLFGLLALQAWAGYVERPHWRRYALVALWFALSLLAKPMWVTFPALLLVLDAWPLRRRIRLAEKLPLLVLSVLSCVATAVAQRGSMTDLSLPPGLRLENAVVGYARYLVHAVWPWPLALHYPYPRDGIPGWQVAAALALLLAITALAVRRVRSAPWMLAGWLWFLGMLVPVIGLVQVGTQAIADRYTYVPLIGVFIIAVWSAAESLPRGHAVAMGAITAALAAVTTVQLGYWSDSETLFRHSLAVEPSDGTMHAALSGWLRQAGRKQEALSEQAEAARLEPHAPAVWNNLAALEAELGRLSDAVVHVTRAIDEDPEYAKAWDNLGHFQLQRGDLRSAAAALERATSLAPDDALAREHLGTAYLKLGAAAEALEQLEEAAHLNPRNASTWTLLGMLHQAQRRPAKAQEAFRTAVQASHGDAIAWRNLGIALAMDGQRDEAAGAFAEALRLRPSDPDLLRRLAEVDPARSGGTGP